MDDMEVNVPVLEGFEIDIEPDGVAVPWGAGKLEKFVPKTPLLPEDVVGRTIVEVEDHCGTYGMGGAGMLALRLDGERRTSHPQQDEKGEWLVIALWGAADHLMLEEKESPWETLSKNKGYQQKLLGKKILGIFIERDDIRIVLEDKIRIIFSPFTRSELNRLFYTGDGHDNPDKRTVDLRTAVFLSPTVYLWI